MSSKIVTSLAKVIGQVPPLARTERNQHGGYNYVSVDSIYAAVSGLLAVEGIILLADEISTEEFESTNKKGESAAWLRARYAFTWHGHGESLGPIHREVVAPLTSAQTSGAMQSYVTKYFLRAALMIQTGEKDDLDGENLPREGAAAKDGRAPRNSTTETKLPKAVEDFVAIIEAGIKDGWDSERAARFEAEPDNLGRMKKLRTEPYAGTPRVATALEALDNLYVGKTS